MRFDARLSGCVGPKSELAGVMIYAHLKLRFSQSRRDAELDHDSIRAFRRKISTNGCTQFNRILDQTWQFSCLESIHEEMQQLSSC